MERYGHLDLDHEVRARLLTASAATLDRLLKPVRSRVVREQSLVVAGLEAIAKQLPFPVLGIDSDNDSVFINDTLTKYCADRGIEFTRSRAYRKNDQAWVEQKNGAVIRRFLGHERYSGQVAGQTIAHLHGVIRLYVNYFQPSFKLVKKPGTARWLPSATVHRPHPATG